METQNFIQKRDINFQKYLSRLNIHESLVANLESLFLIHRSHFYNIPFENLNMHNNEKYLLDGDSILENIINKGRGGICFELCATLEILLKIIGFKYKIRLARSHVPVITGKNHQIFIVDIEDREWILDIGFGAKGSRLPLRLEHGYESIHSFNSTKIEWDNVKGWMVYGKEKLKNVSEWELLYSFHDTNTTKEDLEMAYFYTLHYPNSLHNKNKVISIPTIDGRISIRNDHYTEIGNNKYISKEIKNKEEYLDILTNKFNIKLSS